MMYKNFTLGAGYLIIPFVFLLGGCIKIPDHEAITKTAVSLAVMTSPSTPSLSLTQSSPTQPPSTSTPTPMPATPTPTNSLALTLIPTFSIFLWQPTTNPTAEAIIIQTTAAVTVNESPDKTWRAVTSLYKHLDAPVTGEADWVQTLELEYVPTRKVTLVERHVYNSGGIGAFGIEVLFWSSNNRYLYYTNCAWGQPDGAPYFWNRPVSRLNTVDGSITGFFEGPTSISGDKMLSRERDRMWIVDLINGSEIHTQGLILDTYIVASAWSVDNNAIVYIQSNAEVPPYDMPKTVYLASWDVQTNTHTLLAETEQDFGLVDDANIKWNTQDLIQIRAHQGNWTYDDKTKQLKRVSD